VAQVCDPHYQGLRQTALSSSGGISASKLLRPAQTTDDRSEHCTVDEASLEFFEDPAQALSEKGRQHPQDGQLQPHTPPERTDVHNSTKTFPRASSLSESNIVSPHR
jgi:hypothetical protein